ncbi:MAG TPA: hypothetical protein VJ691_15645 [Vicinamibacterales bacterium]|nr:hypothetical protein [Vicinamibacterales bacterium]
MIRIAAYVIVAGVAAAGTHHVASASARPHLSGDVDILINDVAQKRYAHDGRWYVEAVKGREYAIRLRNPYGVRVAVALSVDGLNTIDARQTTAAEARKWVIDPYQTIVISGWQTSRTDARRFEFTTEENSYGQALGKTANLGVISAVFFKERPRKFIAEEASKDASRAEPRAQAPAAQRRADEEYAATGMGRRTDHAVTQVWLDLEDTPAQTINIRYEFRPQLVRLGILPRTPVADPLLRREGARGFEPGFSPEPPRRK